MIETVADARDVLQSARLAASLPSRREKIAARRKAKREKEKGESGK